MITAEDRTIRRGHLGSSDMGMLFNLDRFGKTVRDLYYSKVGPEIPDEDDASKRMGNLLEDAICGYAGLRLGVEIERNVRAIGADGILACNLDGRVLGQPQGVEAKYVGDPAGWGDEGTDQMPDDVILQCQQQCWVGELELVWVPAFVNMRFRPQFRLYVVHRQDDLVDAIVSESARFWREHVEAKCPPDNAPPPLKILKAMRRAPKSIVDLGDEAIALWAAHEEAKRLEKQTKTKVDDSKAAVLALLGEAEGGRLPDGRLIDFLEQKSPSATDTTMLRARWPEAYDACVKQGRHRVLRIHDKLQKQPGR